MSSSKAVEATVLQTLVKSYIFLLLHEYANVVLKLDITSRFHVCCKIPFIYKYRIKLCNIEAQEY